MFRQAEERIMTADRIRVVVTGLGVTTPLGGDVASTWAALLSGKSGVCRIADGLPADFPIQIAAPIAVDPASVLDRAHCRRMDRCEQFALIAARQAWQDAGAPEVDQERLGVCMGTGIGGLGSTFKTTDTIREQSWQKLSPFTVPMIMPNGAASWIGLEFGARAGVHTTASACASGNEAIGYGIQMIRSCRADVVIAGGAEAPIFLETLAAFAVIRALSCRNDQPELASRPFDQARDGFVLAEGAGAVVLESAEHAMRRGAVVLAVAAGVGYSADAYQLTQTDPEGTGPAKAIRRALDDARVPPEQIVHINAHATSTPVGDSLELLAIRRALGSAASRVLVSATKSMTGHMLGGAGAVEAVATICALREGIAPPTINLEKPDDAAIEGDVHIVTEPQELPATPARAAALNNSFGFGGHNVTLVFTAP
jgi:3-oxoacyl-[acyl-carrier-protein] synthase II